MLAKSKYNSIESFISQALNDIDISHQESFTILNKKNKYERMKYNLIFNIFFLVYIKNVRDNKKELLQMRFRKNY